MICSFLGLVARYNKALASVQRSQQVATPDNRRLFCKGRIAKYITRGSKRWKREKNAWKHKFMSLAYLEQQVPLKEAE